MARGQLEIFSGTITSTTTAGTAVAAVGSNGSLPCEAIGGELMAHYVHASNANNPAADKLDLEYSTDGTNYEKMVDYSAATVQFTLAAASKSLVWHRIAAPHGATYFRIYVSTAPAAGETYVGAKVTLYWGTRR